MKTKLILCAGLALLLVSCSKYGLNTPLGGTQSPIGEVNTTFTFSEPWGMTGTTAKVTSLTGGVSKISFTTNVTDSKMLALAEYLNGSTVSGSKVTGEFDAKFTSEGIETVHEGGKLILVKYDAPVGAKYKLKSGDEELTREVTSKSTDDDFYWGGMFIKTMVVEETGHTAPGISKVEYFANHKFGLVGIYLHYADGTKKYIDIFASKTN